MLGLLLQSEQKQKPIKSFHFQLTVHCTPLSIFLCKKLLLSRSHGITTRTVPVPAVTAVMDLVLITVVAVFPR